MTVTANATWKEAVLCACPKIRMVVSIVAGGTTYTAASGGFRYTASSTLFEIPSAVLKVSPLQAELNPITREFTMEKYFIEFQREWLYPILVNRRLRGCPCTIKVGAQSLDSASDLVQIFTGPIEEIEIQPDRIVAIVSNVLAVLDQTPVTGQFNNCHPIAMMYNSSNGILDLAKLSTTYIETTSFDITTATYSTVSHWSSCFLGGRSDKFGVPVPIVDQPTSALQLCKEICESMNTSLIVREDGKIRVLWYDSTAAAVDSWTMDDIRAGTFKHKNSDLNVVNQVTYECGEKALPLKTHTGDPDKDQELTNAMENIGYSTSETSCFFTANETASQTAYAAFGQTAKTFPMKITSRWVGPEAHIYNDVAFVAGDTALNLTLVTALTGMAFSYPAASQPAWAKLGVNNPAYFYLDKGCFPGSEMEIVKATESTVLGAPYVSIFMDPDDGSDSASWVGAATTYTVARGQLGTSDKNHTGYASLSVDYMTSAWDITIPVYVANQILMRAGFGCPVLEFETSLSKFETQIGEFVTLTVPVEYFSDYGMEGITTSTKWEVTGKETDFFADPPKIKWTVAMVRTDAATVGASAKGSCRMGEGKQSARASVDADTVKLFVVDGLAVSDAGGLNTSIAAGTCGVRPFNFTTQTAVTMPCTASKDNYILVNPATKGFRNSPVANGAAAPSKAKAELWLAKVVTNADDITSLTDMRDQLPIKGSKLEAGTGPITNMGQTGVFNSFANITTKTLDLVDDGATYLRVTGVSAGHQIQAGSIATSAVEESKINTGAVTANKVGNNVLGTQHLVTDVPGRHLNTNFNHYLGTP
jgi:hypothetical protein